MPTSDIRAEAAQYYDLGPDVPDDVGFYQGKIPSPDASVKLPSPRLSETVCERISIGWRQVATRMASSRR